MADGSEKKDGAATDAAPAKAGKGKLMLILLPVLGLLLGGGGVAGYFLVLAPPPGDAAAVAEAKVEEAPIITPVFVKLERLSAPLIDAKGRLAGYVGLDFQLEVDGDENAQILEDHMPMVRHAVNMALNTKGGGMPDNPRLIDYEGIAATTLEAANQSLPKPLILSVQIQSATPR